MVLEGLSLGLGQMFPANIIQHINQDPRWSSKSAVVPGRWDQERCLGCQTA